MNWYALLPLAAFFANIALACFILYRDPKAKLNRTYTFITVALVIWALGDLLIFTAITSEAAMIGNKIGIVGTSVTAPFLLYFFLLFTKNKFIRT